MRPSVCRVMTRYVCAWSDSSLVTEGFASANALSQPPNLSAVGNTGNERGEFPAGASNALTIV
jgi:hypothetical protein